jgi:hypothetical protein
MAYFVFLILICGAKKYSLVPSGKSLVDLRASRARSRGAFRDRHERWMRDAMDALVSPDERRRRGRRSRVVLMPRRWH